MGEPEDESLRRPEHGDGAFRVNREKRWSLYYIWTVQPLEW